MKTPRSLPAIVEDQCRKWNARPPPATALARCSVITLSREPGTRARAVARLLAERTGYDVYGTNIVDAVAKSARCSEIVVRSLDERGRSFVEDLISSVGRGLTADEYLHHLASIIATIASHGRAIILGRGASCILPRASAVRVRFIAPLDMRVESFVREFGLAPAEARRRIRQLEDRRRRFIRDAFRQDIADPAGYDLVVNDEWISAEAATAMILAALQARNV
jgi:cytidylate kinase